MKKTIAILTSLLVVSSLLAGCSKPTIGSASESTDVVIIGAGGAGLAAGISAAEKGAKVIILEKMPMVGGNTLRSSGGINAAGTKEQAAQGIKDSVDAFYQDTMKGGYNKNNPELVKTLAENSAGAVEWLKSLGAEFEKPVRGGGATIDRLHPAKGGVPIGEYIVPILKKAAEDKKVDIRLWNKVTEILKDKDGNVTGVKAINKEGKEYTIKAKSVIDTAGGFGANLEMVVKYNPDLKNFQTTNQPGATGDGMIMAEKIGAQLIDMKEIQIHPTTIPGNGFLVSEAVRSNGAILVNHEGKRFINELLTRDVVSKGILALPEKTAYLVFDDSMRKSAALFEEYFKSGFVVEGNTLEDLASKIKVNPQNLKTTVDTYNKAVTAKNDAEFKRNSLPGKIETAKFYAIEITPGIHHTMGGVKINTNTEVINTENKPIKNLYAAGETTGGVHGGNRLGGNAVADIIVFGRIAGENAAKNALAK